MKKVVVNIFICLYFVITILITYSLLSYNEFNVTEFNNSSLVIIKDKMDSYNDGDLLIVKKNDSFTNDDSVFYYDTYSSPVKVKLGKIVDVQTDNVVLDNNQLILKENILGKEKDVKSYAGVGWVLSVLTSKWGYLIIIIFPMLLAFIYEVYEIMKEIKKK